MVNTTGSPNFSTIYGLGIDDYVTHAQPNKTEEPIDIYWCTDLHYHFYHYLCDIVICLSGVIAVFANSLIIAVFIQDKEVRTVSNTFIVNLAIFDIIAAIGVFISLVIAGMKGQYADVTCYLHKVMYGIQMMGAVGNTSSIMLIGIN